MVATVRYRGWRVAALIALLAGALLAYPAVAAQPRPSTRPLITGVVDPFEFTAPGAPTAFAHVRATGATVVRLSLSWAAVAPGGATRPAGFDPRDPSDPAYNWSGFDSEVAAATSAGLEPLVTVGGGAPKWAAPTPINRAQDGPTRPNPAAFGDFATAAARRYSGATAELPRIRYWQGFNEPNVSVYLMPQYEGSKTISPYWYRRLINAFSDAVHRVKADNVSIAGGLSPFSVRNAAVETVGPLRFLRLLLCVSGGAHPHATCGTHVRFDVLAIHPYTSGDPQHRAGNPNDLSLGDLPELRPLVRAAVASGHLQSRHPLQTWVTEFSWDSRPPDPGGVPLRLEARWTSEALYRMWSAGINLVTWFTIRDLPRTTSDFQSGLFRRGATIALDRPKPALTAFAFPFVAYREGPAVSVWGRTPARAAGAVRIEQKIGAGPWVQLAQLRAGAHGIFQGLVRSRAKTGYLRAVAARGAATSLGFSLTRPPDYPVDPFGLTSSPSAKE